MKAAEILKKCFLEIPKIIKVGMTELELSDAVRDIIEAEGGECYSRGYQGYPGDLCISVNERICHGVPRVDYQFQLADIVNVDIVVKADNKLADAARTFQVGKRTRAGNKLIHGAKKAVYAGISKLKAGVDITVACKAMAKSLEQSELHFYPCFLGHGINPALHQPPWSNPDFVNIPSYILKVGDMLTLEPHVCLYPPFPTIDSDQFTLIDLRADNYSAMHEEMVLITEDGCIVLTKED